MSRFNTLYLGSAEDVAAEFGDGSTPTADELRLALINAMNRIHRLEVTITRLCDSKYPVKTDPPPPAPKKYPRKPTR